MMTNTYPLADYIEAHGGICKWCGEFDKKHPPAESWNSTSSMLRDFRWLEIFELIKQEYYEQALEA